MQVNVFTWLFLYVYISGCIKSYTTHHQRQPNAFRPRNSPPSHHMTPNSCSQHESPLNIRSKSTLSALIKKENWISILETIWFKEHLYKLPHHFHTLSPCYLLSYKQKGFLVKCDTFSIKHVSTKETISIKWEKSMKKSKCFPFWNKYLSFQHSRR